MDFDNLLKNNFPFFFSDNSDSTKNLDIYSNFKLPIQYLDEKNLYTLNDSISSDLELNNIIIDSSSNDIDSSSNIIDSSMNSFTTNTMYDHFVCPSNPFQNYHSLAYRRYSNLELAFLR